MSPICELDQVLAQREAQQLAEAWDSGDQPQKLMENNQEAFEVQTASENQTRPAHVRKVPTYGWKSLLPREGEEEESLGESRVGVIAAEEGPKTVLISSILIFCYLQYTSWDSYMCWALNEIENHARR